MYQGQTLIVGDTFEHKHTKAECVINQIIYDNQGIFNDRTEGSSILAVNALITKRENLDYADDNFWMKPTDFSMYWMKQKPPEQEQRYRHSFDKLWHKIR